MSITLWMCMLLTQILLSFSQVFCIPIFLNTQSVFIDKDASSAKSHNTSTRSDGPKDTVVSNVMTGKSKSAILTIKAETEKHDYHRTPFHEDSKIEHTSPAKSTNKTLTSKTQSLVRDLLTKVVNATISKENIYNKTAIFLNSKQPTKIKLLNKTIAPDNKVRYARSAYRDYPQPYQSGGLQPDGYVYDINRCLYVDNRILCGYEKNPQPPKKKDIVDLDDLCRKHGDRVECGYIKGPFPDVYNLDPERDRIAKISLANYPNIARTKYKKLHQISSDDSSDNDNDNDSQSSNTQYLRSEIVGLKEEISKLKHTLPTATSVHTEVVVKETLRPKITLSEMVQASSEPEKLTLAKLMPTEINAFQSSQSKKTSKKKCIEKDDRIFCRTVLE